MAKLVVFFTKCNLYQFLFVTEHNNMTNSATVWAIRTNMQKKRGRADRVKPGFAFHLCSRARYNKLNEHMTPEMFQTILPVHQTATTQIRRGVSVECPPGPRVAGMVTKHSGSPESTEALRYVQDLS